MNKIAIILLVEKTYYFPYIKRNDVDIITVCDKNEKKWLRLCKYFPSYVERIIEKKLKKNNYKTVIVFDIVLKFLPNLINRIQKLECRKVLYFWNMINESTIKLTKKFVFFDDVYSFSLSDSKKYDIKYLPLMAANILNDTLEKKVLKYDFFFLGYLKNRKRIILEVLSKLSNFKLKCFVIGNEVFDSDFIEFRSSRMEYMDYIKYLQQSKCIIDIYDDNQDGYTLRMAEAFCYNKKIITTNRNVLNSDFFDESRILIYDEKLTYNDIETFLKKPISLTDNKYFDFDTWLNNIVI